MPDMNCPNCNAPFKCPCNACTPRHLKADPNYQPTWEYEGDLQRCLTCGKVEHEGWWLDEEVRQLQERTGTTTLTEAIQVLQQQRAEENQRGEK